MDALALRRHAHHAHRWLGLVVAPQVFVWLAGGLTLIGLRWRRGRLA